MEMVQRASAAISRHCFPKILRFIPLAIFQSDMELSFITHCLCDGRKWRNVRAVRNKGVARDTFVIAEPGVANLHSMNRITVFGRWRSTSVSFARWRDMSHCVKQK